MSESDVNGRKSNSRIDIRLASVARVKNGESPASVAKHFGVHRVSIYRWLSSFEKTGIDGLASKRAPGKDPLLQPPMFIWICEVIAQSRPEKFGFDQAVWTLDLIRELIGKEFNLKLSRRSVGRLLKKVGLDVKRPSNGIFRSDSDRIQAWIHADFKGIRDLGRHEKAEIFFVELVRLNSFSDDSKARQVFVAVTLRGHLYFQGESVHKGTESLGAFLNDLDTTHEGRKCIVLFDQAVLPEDTARFLAMGKLGRWVFQVTFPIFGQIN